MEWHIQDFPKELIVKLKKGYLEEVTKNIGGQRKTARLLDVSFPSLHAVISGKKVISLKRLFKIINLSTQKGLFLKKLEENVEAIKAPSSRAYWVETENFMEVSCPSAIGRIISKLFGKFGTYDGKVPEVVINSKLNIKKNLLGAIFDDECTVEDDSIVVALTNKKLIHQIGKLLNEFNIKCHYGTGKDKRPNRKLQYTLSVRRIRYLRRFANKIELSHSFKSLEIENG